MNGERLAGERPRCGGRAVGEWRPRATRPMAVAASQRLRRRFTGIARFVLFLALIFVAVWAGVRVAHAGEVGDVYSGRSYTVRSGDTLWRIADRSYGEGVDLRAAVYAIREASGLASPVLRPGQTLTLPRLED